MFMNRWPYTTVRGIVHNLEVTLVKVPGSIAQWGKNSGPRNLAS